MPLSGKDRVKSFESKCETRASIIAIAPKDLSQPIVASTAANLDHPFGGSSGDFKHNLRIEANSPPEAEVEIHSIDGNPKMLEGLDQRPDGGDRVGGEPFEFGRESVDDQMGQALQLGEGARSIADPIERIEPGMSLVPLAAESFEDLSPTPPSLDDRNQGPKEPLNSAIVDAFSRQGKMFATRSPSQPIREVIQAPAHRTNVPTLGGSLAEHLDERSLSGRRETRPTEHFENESDVSDSNPGVFHSRGVER